LEGGSGQAVTVAARAEPLQCAAASWPAFQAVRQLFSLTLLTKPKLPHTMPYTPTYAYKPSGTYISNPQQNPQYRSIVNNINNSGGFTNAEARQLGFNKAGGR